METNELQEMEVAVIDAVFQGALPLATPPTPVHIPDPTARPDRPALLPTDRPIRIGPSSLRNYLRELQREFEEQEAIGKL